MIYLVSRHPAEGWLSKRVVRLDGGPTVLDWFRHAYAASRAVPDVHDWLDSLCDPAPYGFSSLFEQVQALDLPTPESVDELRAQLHAHLYVEGDEDYVRIDDAHSLRVRTDDDDFELAYYLFDETFRRAHPDRVAWLLTEKAPPDTAREAEYDPPVEADPLEEGSGEGRTWVVLSSLDGQEFLEPPGPWVFEGVRLADLGAHLCGVDPEPDTWPDPLRVLRACVDPDKPSLQAAFAAIARPEIAGLAGNMTWDTLVGPIADVRAELAELAAVAKAAGTKRKPATVHAGENRVLASFPDADGFYHSQWILFDDLWAARQPGLADALLLYNCGWDVLAEDDPV